MIKGLPELSEGYEIAFVRYFLQDAAEASLLPSEEGAACAVVQPPLCGTQAGAWVWLVSEFDTMERKGNRTMVMSNGVRHLWTGGTCFPLEDSGKEGLETILEYEGILGEYGMDMEKDCVRTWFFVKDIDNNYKDFVVSRRERFSELGMTADTHYIASTGICGEPVVKGATVLLDTYAISGEASKQYLYAPDFLNRTSEYGVTFERGVTVSYDTDQWISISGTASIDNKGQILHEGDVAAQCIRMLTNVEALLAEAGSSLKDIPALIVYLRNREDAQLVHSLISSRFPNKEFIILEAPVCRPGWLIEMECSFSL